MKQAEAIKKKTNSKRNSMEWFTTALTISLVVGSIAVPIAVKMSNEINAIIIKTIIPIIEAFLLFCLMSVVISFSRLVMSIDPESMVDFNSLLHIVLYLSVVFFYLLHLVVLFVMDGFRRLFLVDEKIIETIKSLVPPSK